MWQLHRHGLLVALAALLCLNLLQHAAAEYEEELEDKPYVNFNTLFRAYIAMGDALFGNWAPADYAQELQHLRTAQQ
ncbi:uncharacterized protein LOC6579145 [Drosophila mojavensis]|uniref:Uncharacterized protein n=1 Tax=Drosophila mojavensis TaxID=7230 RepID=B4KNT2_DROMO|nr:uncharacterized protein LOC6579145 [Drosophila mojavensis]EDW08977.1 uncharacterized protein Dmoj_GI20250 [Drosophila mojavensis]